MNDVVKSPKHVAIIMDGNRRWAKKRGLAAVAGHAFATDSVVEKIIERAGELGISYLTLWAFSTENWERDADEVSAVMNIFRKALATKVEKFIQKGARLQLIGDTSRFAPDIQKGMEQAIEKSKNNTKITVTFALNYGGRDEILRAVNRLISESANQHILRQAQDLVGDSVESAISDGQKTTEERISAYLDTAGMPDPDLVIRTGGEQRLSGFLMWQAAYSELYFTDVLFPDFTPSEFDRALEEYQNRQRRFGK